MRGSRGRITFALLPPPWTIRLFNDGMNSWAEIGFNDKRGEDSSGWKSQHGVTVKYISEAFPFWTVQVIEEVVAADQKKWVVDSRTLSLWAPLFGKTETPCKVVETTTTPPIIETIVGTPFPRRAVKHAMKSNNLVHHHDHGRVWTWEALTDLEWRNPSAWLTRIPIYFTLFDRSWIVRQGIQLLMLDCVKLVSMGLSMCTF